MYANSIIIDKWLESKKASVKQSTLAQYRRLAYTAFSNINLEENFDEIQYTEFLQSKYKPKSIRDILAVTNQVFRFATEQGLIISNPHISLKMPQTKRVSINVLNMDECRQFTKYLTDQLDSSKLGILISLYTGIRLGEICALRWDDVDFNNGILKIRKTVQRISDGSGKTFFLIDTPKTLDSYRDVPIPDFLLKILQDYSKHYSDKCYIASGKENFVQPRTYQQRLKRYLSSAGLPAHHFHTLRHTFASRAVELGFDIKTLSEILGHSNTKTTMDLYVHPSMEMKRREMNKFNEIV